MDENQVKARSSGDNNHGYDWGKTAVEMALLRNEALAIKGSESKATLGAMGFGKAGAEDSKKPSPRFF
jgi:6,7-dimethyl-8-ribityllumazine synthase